MKSTMQALVCRAPGDFSLEPVEVGEPQTGEVKLRVLYAGICGSDLAIVRGRNPFAHYPLIPGHEFCGEVMESRDPTFRPGQLVVVMPVVGCGECDSCRTGNVNRCRQVRLYGVHMDGGFAEFAVVRASNLVLVDTGLNSRQVAFTEPLAVGVHCNRRGSTNKGSAIAIIGGGIIGLVILKVAKVLQAAPILVIDVIAERLERARHLGADHIFNASQNGLKELSQNRVFPNGYDIVYDVVGSEETLDVALDLLKPGGKLVMVAVQESERKYLDVKKIFAQEKVFTASRTYSMEDFTHALNLIVTHQVDPGSFITSEYPLGSIGTALERAEKWKNEELKVLVKV